MHPQSKQKRSAVVSEKSWATMSDIEKADRFSKNDLKLLRRIEEIVHTDLTKAVRLRVSVKGPEAQDVANSIIRSAVDKSRINQSINSDNDIKE